MTMLTRPLCPRRSYKRITSHAAPEGEGFFTVAGAGSDRRAGRCKEKAPRGLAGLGELSWAGGLSARQSCRFRLPWCADRRRPPRGRASRRRALPLQRRSEEHTSELQSLMRISYAVFCLKKQHNQTHSCESTYILQ